MSNPNIFSYATKELSQDAFICWLIACAIKATGNLQECGLAFVRTLFRAGASNGTKGIPVLDPDGNPIAPYNGPCEVSDVCTPVRQYGKEKIDVYFQAKVDGKMGSFSIEDKVDTEAHSNQLKRSLDYVINDDQEEDLIKPVYFKTGYVFDDERDAVKKDKYSVFEAKDLKKFLNCHPNAIREDQILRQYVEYLNDKIQTRAEALKNWDFEQDYVQWEFLLKLRRVLRNADGEWQHFVSNKLSGEPRWEKPDKPYWTWNGLWRGNIKGSRPWTHYWFSRHLFWKLDSRIPLRLMINLNEAKTSYDVVPEYRNRFNEALQKEGLRARKVEPRKRDECTIGSIDTENLRGMTKSELRKFLDSVKRVHIEFLQSYRQICRQ